MIVIVADMVSDEAENPEESFMVAEKELAATPQGKLQPLTTRAQSLVPVTTRAKSLVPVLPKPSMDDRVVFTWTHSTDDLHYFPMEESSVRQTTGRASTTIPTGFPITLDRSGCQFLSPFTISPNRSIKLLAQNMIILKLLEV